MGVYRDRAKRELVLVLDVQVCGCPRSCVGVSYSHQIPWLTTPSENVLDIQKSLPRIRDCICRLLPKERKKCKYHANSKRHIQNPPPQTFFKIRRKPTPITLLLLPNDPYLRIQSRSPGHRSRRYGTDDRLQQSSRARVFRLAPNLQIAEWNMRPRREQHRHRSSLAHLPHLTHPSWYLCHDVAVVLGVHWVADHVDGTADVDGSVDEPVLLGCRSLWEWRGHREAYGVPDLVV
jgi:hypothetical protein